MAFRKRAMQEWGYKKNELGANLWVTLTTIMQLELENYDFTPMLKQVKQPYLFLAGSKDRQMDFEKLTSYVKSMENANLEIVENSGHLFDNPNEMVKKIRSFISSIESN